MWGSMKAIGDAGLSILGLLLLADVKLLGGGLALGEGVTAGLSAFLSTMAIN